MAYRKQYKKSYKKPYKKTYKKKSYKKPYKKAAYKKKSYQSKKNAVINGGTGPRHSSCKHMFAKHALVPKIFKMLTAPMRYKYNDSDRSFSNPARQFTFDIAQFGDRDDLARILQAARTQLGQGTPTTPKDSDSVYLLNSSGEYLLMNNSLAPLELDIYDYICVRDTQYRGDSMFNFVDSFSYPLSGSVNPVASDLPGVFPSDSVAFRKAYKVLKRTRVQLNAGQGHKHTVQNVYNKFVSQAMLGEETIYYKGYTSGVLLVGKGYPVHSTADADNTAYAGVRVDCSGCVSYNYRWRNPTREHMDYDDTMPQILPADQTLINQNGSTVAAGVLYS